MPFPSTEARALSAAQIDAFIADGFVRINDAFPAALAEAARKILWRDMGLDPDDPSGWTPPVIRLGMYADAPFIEAANTPTLRTAYDQLVGSDRWLPPRAMGTFPVRFPSGENPGDDGWHVDVSFGQETADFMEWRANLSSKGRALLMLFLFSDVGEADAPTRIRKGSHLDIARILAPHGDEGLTLRELAARFPETEGREEVLATGRAGTVYLCHPFLVHAAQPHRGTAPRFLAQPPLLPRGPSLSLKRPDADYAPVETAIRRALGHAPSFGEIRAHIEALPGVVAIEADEDVMFHVDPEGTADYTRSYPLATLLTSSRRDTASDLDRPGVFRLNLRLAPADAGALSGAGTADYTALDTLMPHPQFASAGYACVLNPQSTWPQVRQLLERAHKAARQ